MDIYDPAYGPTRADNAGLGHRGLPHFQGRQWEGVENVSNLGEYTAPRNSYQRYLVGPEATDVLNPSMNNFERGTGVA
jgi:hypothetical protein